MSTDGKVKRFLERYEFLTNWLNVAASIVAATAVAAGVYVANKTLTSINESVVEAGRSADVAERALGVSMANMRTQNALIASSQRQMDLTLQQIQDERDALWLEQRAWVNHRAFQLEVRDEDGNWSAGEIEDGQEFRIRIFFENVGETPATDVWFASHLLPRLLPVGDDPPEGWDGAPRDERSTGAIIMPGQGQTEELSRTHEGTMDDRGFAQYSGGTHGLFFWSEVTYCDLAGRFHWARVGVMRHHGRQPDQVDIQVHEHSPLSSGRPDPEHCPAG